MSDRKNQASSSAPTAAPIDLPPSYDAVTSEAGSSTTHTPRRGLFGKHRSPEAPQSPAMKDLQSGFPHQPAPTPHYQVASPSSPNTPVYHYQNPRTGEVVTTFYPPDHPAMQCLQTGKHVSGSSRFGIVGVLSAILFFPLGVAVCLVDRKVQCRRCGYVIHEGLSA